jgi:hypothetical protein
MQTMTTLFATLVVLSVAGAQDPKEMPKPQKEHELLKQFEGHWETSSRYFAKPRNAEESKGTETAKVAYGGYWLVIDFKCVHQGQPFEGSGTVGYDPRKAKYVMTWIDSAAPYCMSAEGTADPAGKVFTFVGDGCDPETGKAAKVRIVYHLEDPDHRSLTFYVVGTDAPDRRTGEIQYSRKK